MQRARRSALLVTQLFKNHNVTLIVIKNYFHKAFCNTEFCLATLNVRCNQSPENMGRKIAIVSKSCRSLLKFPIDNAYNKTIVSRWNSLRKLFFFTRSEFAHRLKKSAKTKIRSFRTYWLIWHSNIK